MRFLRIALCGAFISIAGLRAADEEKGPVPEEIPDFNQMDEYTYVPKSTLSLGSRFFLAGPKTTYAGQGTIPSASAPGVNPPLGANTQRIYADGTVLPDARTVVDSNGIGQGSFQGISSDGRTNSWSYTNASQLQPNGDIDFHTYSTTITDTTEHDVTSDPTVGLELVMDRDMGKIGKLKWSITAGLSIADIHSSSYAAVPGVLHTTTDTYDLFGQFPPAAPYQSPTTATQTVTSGTASASSTQIVDQTILLGNVPVSRTPLDTDVLVQNRYFIEGAYYTFRIGPTVYLPITKHWNLSVSAGPALIYAGSELNVLEDLSIATGEDFTQIYQKENNHLLPAYYVDVNLQYQLTDTAGFYVGGVYQGSGSYTQSVPSGGGSAYSSKIDFESQEGVKGGMTVRF